MTLLQVFRIVEEIAWAGGFVLVASKTSLWVALGVSGMFLGHDMAIKRKGRED